jgi:hypothetical protein
MQTALVADTIRPVLIGYLGITSDPLVAWTGPGVFAPTGTADDALNGQTFLPLAPFVKMSNIVEDQSIGGPVTLTVSGQDLDDVALRQVVRDKRAWRGKPAYLWLGLLNSNEYAVIADPVRIKTGVMTGMVVSRRVEEHTVSVEIDRDLGNARSAPFRWVDHTRLFPNDTGTTYVRKLANKPEGLTSSDINSYTVPIWHDPNDWSGYTGYGSYGGWCWLAIEIYGITSFKWLVFREWLLNQAPDWFFNFYTKRGEKLANYVKDRPKFKPIIKYFMDKVVVRYA